MSWAEEDWTVGLSGRVLQKVKELQVHQERLSRENKQKQLQLDNIHTSLEKQTVKYEEVRGELQSAQRELQNVREEAKAAVIGRERLTQELQTKQAQVCSLEGQLDATRTNNNKLTQEVKRLEAELEKLQNSSRSADTTLFSTPCWNTTSPWEQNGSRKEERQDESRALHIRRLQFSDVPSASLQRPQHKSTPHRHPSDQSESFSTPLAAFPWERDDSRPASRRQSPSSPQTPCTGVISQGQSELGVCGKEKDHRMETDKSLSEMRSRVSRLEEELSVKAGTLKSIQSEMVQSKKELAARELSLQKARDELSLVHTRITQESERASGAEQRLKQLQEELKCQRQNAESSRLQHQQRTKEMEKQHQRDLTELQKERQGLERQHQQEVNKLNQELQQARTLHNALQAQADKLSLQKQALDKELDTLKEKLKWTEGQLKESQKKEAQMQAKLTEVVREAEGVAVSLEQSRKKERGLEEEGRRLAEERADALRLLKELQEQKAAPATPLQPVQFCPVGQSFPPQPSSTHSRPSPHTKRRAAACPSRAEEGRGGAREGEEGRQYNILPS
ncbi:centromere protein F isoform X2 [Lates calcarifer]|uniref:Centromere protein F isoform X2 n=1 Tax=Lates calcarifer TaxID=8187 RepID=A0AAJ7L7D9_LATCA|nr:centromere protein F isoform X2 [Lates calcarifer]